MSLPPILRVVLAFLAVYRASHLISREEGPFLGPFADRNQTGFLERVRIHLGVYDFGPDGETTNLARGIACPLCVGVYLSWLASWVVLRPSRISDSILLWLGISGAQSFLERISD